MLVIRAAKTSDLDALIDMARQAGSGMTTLKPDPVMLGDRLAHSRLLQRRNFE